MHLRYSFILSFLLFNLAVFSQNIDDLQSEKKRLEEELKKSSKMLVLYGNQKNKAITNIKLINAQITSREELINVYNKEISLINDDIHRLRIDIEKSVSELEQIKADYARLIQKSFENRKIYNEVAFFLGAESFNAAYRRFILFKEYNKFRKNQGILIQTRTSELEEKKSLLEVKLKVQNTTLQSVLNEKEELLKSRKNLDQSIDSLKRKERQLKAQIKKNQESLEKLEQAILKLIEESSKESFTASDFNKAIGKLKWPVNSGIIISKFGEHQHPVLKYVKVNNNGVDIQCQNDNKCKVVFDGVVSRIVTIPGYNKTVIIRHGKYLTVYANLKSVLLKKGDKVIKGSLIGEIYDGEGENSNVLHFEIWEQNVKLNPEKWLIN
ncbi:murein hydrolase activator EnvC family protein [Carboxylicivirga caseinilyticus]|uniref:murein hydrolase activator EnvC family protein n=1 Tax=Carboxylicivirga caseinilyticus TaxID=3417572 RepID=UPI003D353DAA|nr:peptidoglycan DD-metalloendopeptidase family protein [Marinilabiliaceae bacterium A049]